ncbi:MAG: cobalamin-dependent protein [Deltaproteobacteria bacterium]|nr:cobalamin-dependent protein [Deltaproteobacteria bacterium]
MSTPSHDEMKQAVIDGDVDAARALAEAVVASGADLLPAVEDGFAAGIRRVGELWEEGEYFLPELVQGAEAMKAAMAVIRPALALRRGSEQALGRVVIGTVQGDLHDIGKTLVGTLLAANGFEVFDLGTDVPVEAFVAKAREVGANVVGASALLTTTMTWQKTLVEAVAASDLPKTTRVIVGGSPTTPAWASEIGAAYAENAMRAVTVTRELVAGAVSR